MSNPGYTAVAQDWRGAMDRRWGSSEERVGVGAVRVFERELTCRRCRGRAIAAVSARSRARGPRCRVDAAGAPALRKPRASKELRTRFGTLARCPLHHFTPAGWAGDRRDVGSWSSRDQSGATLAISPKERGELALGEAGDPVLLAERPGLGRQRARCDEKTPGVIACC